MELGPLNLSMRVGFYLSINDVIVSLKEELPCNSSQTTIYCKI